MRVTDLLSLLWRPLAAVSGLLITVTFLMRVPSIEAWGTDRLIGQLDLWTERSVAAAFSSGVFLIAALSFVPMAWPAAPTRRLPGFDLLVMRLAAIGLAFFALDELLQIHEALGARVGGSALVAGSAFEDGVFSWVLVYGPVVILGAGALLVVMGRAIDAAPESGATRADRPLLAWIVLGPVAILVCEVVEAHLWGSGAGMTTLGAIEESLELVTLLAVVHLNIAVARDYRA